jgi:hypothetical protein
MNGTPTKAACNRTLNIFDGYQRYDLKLSFKRLDTIDLKEVHDGPVVVCGVVHEPIAGHLTSDTFIRFLSGREIEAVLAPLDGTPFLVPVRVSFAGMLANLVIQANRFRSIR